MSRIYKISDTNIISLSNLIKYKEASPHELRNALYVMGIHLAQHIISKLYVNDKEFFTPFDFTLTGPIPKLPASVIITTKSDCNTLGDAFCKAFTNGILGYIDFHGERGEEAMKSPIRQITLPEMSNKWVECLVVVKSVLATGCTAISLTRVLV